MSLDPQPAPPAPTPGPQAAPPTWNPICKLHILPLGGLGNGIDQVPAPGPQVIANLNLKMIFMRYPFIFLDHKPLQASVHAILTPNTNCIGSSCILSRYKVPPDTNCTDSSRIPSRRGPLQGSPLMHSKTPALLMIQGDERMRCKKI